MEILKRLKEDGIAKRQVEEALYNRVVEELAQGERREGLWAKAFADAEGIETKAQGLYIKYRVQSLVDELELQAAQEEKEKVYKAAQKAKEAAEEKKKKSELPTKSAEELMGDGDGKVFIGVMMVVFSIVILIGFAAA